MAKSKGAATGMIEFPIAELPSGYVSMQVNGPVTERQANALKRLCNGLDKSGAVASRRGGPPERVTPDFAIKGVRWMLDQLADAMGLDEFGELG